MPDRLYDLINGTSTATESQGYAAPTLPDLPRPKPPDAPWDLLRYGREAVADSWNATKAGAGAVYGVPATLAAGVKGIGENAWEGFKALNGYNSPNMPVRERLEKILAGATGGLSNVAKTRAEEARKEVEQKAKFEGRTPTLTEHLEGVSTSILKSLWDVAGGQDYTKALSGKDPQGKDLDSFDRGKSLTGGLVSTAMLLGLDPRGSAAKPIEPPIEFSRNKWVGQVAKDLSDRAGIPFEDALERIENPTGKTPIKQAGDVKPDVDTNPITPADHAQLPEILSPKASSPTEAAPIEKWKDLQDTHELISNPKQAKIINDLLNDETFQKALENFIPKGKEGHVDISDIGIQHIRDGVLSPDSMRDIVQTNEIAPADLPQIVADRLKDTTEFQATGLGMWGNLIQQMYEETTAKADSGDLAAKVFQNTLEKWYSDARGVKPLTWLEKSVGWWKSFVIGSAKTTLRIGGSEIFTGLSQIFSHAVSGTVEALMNQSRTEMGLPEGKTLSSHYGDLISDLTSLAHIRKGSEAIDALLHADPINKQTFKRGTDLDIFNEISKNAAKRVNEGLTFNGKEVGGLVGEKIANGMDAASMLFTIGHRVTTYVGRNFFFESRFLGNLDKLGMTPKDFINAYRQPEGLTPEVGSAYNDALGHAMKQTFQYVAKDSLEAKVLETYKRFGPMSYWLGPSFPRFLMNTFRWQFEHSPAGLTNLFNPEFRAQLAEGGLGGRMAARKIGDALTGSLMLSGAWATVNDENAGPKYYQVLNSFHPKNADGGPNWQDMRGHVPIAPYLFVAKLAQHVTQGTPMNLSPSEWSDALDGVRSLAQTPITVIPAIMEQLANTKSEDDVPPAIKRIIGDWAGGWLRPLKELDTLFGLAGRHQELEQKDLKNNEITGPMQQSLPIAMESLPSSVNLFTGRPKTISDPGGDVLGFTQRGMTRLEDLTTRHGLTESNLAGSHGSPEADRLVKHNIGTILSSEISKNHTAGDEFTDLVRGMHLPAYQEKQAIEKLFQEVRKVAVDEAQHTHPELFLSHAVSHLPMEEQKQIRNVLVPK